MAHCLCRLAIATTNLRVQKAFTPKVVQSLAPRITEICNELLDQAEERGGMDGVEDYAYPLPVRVICEMLGVPLEDDALFKQWSKVLARSLDPDFFATNASRIEPPMEVIAAGIAVQAGDAAHASRFEPPMEVIAARASFAVYFSGPVRESRRLRCQKRGQQSPLLRSRHPPLPRGSPGQAGRKNRSVDTLQKVSESRDGRRARFSGQLRSSRTRTSSCPFEAVG